MSENKKIINFPGGKVKEEISVAEVLMIKMMEKILLGVWNCFVGFLIMKEEQEIY